MTSADDADHAVALDLAGTLSDVLLGNDMLIARLRVYYNYFPPAPRVVRIIMCKSTDNARALLHVVLEPNTTVHRVASALTTYAVVGEEPYEAHVHRYHTEDFAATLKSFAASVRWTKENLFHLMVVSRSRSVSAFAYHVAVLVPEWAVDSDASARDDKRSIFAAYENLTVRIADKTTSVRKTFAIALPRDCETCGARAEHSVCGACMIVCYCSRECQRARYKTHARECVRYRQLYDDLQRPT